MEWFIDIGFGILVMILATLYASVGHGGASGYLALMALFSFVPEQMKPIALTLNIFVSAISFWKFYSSGHFKWKLFYPFAIASIPTSFIGGLIEINTVYYKQLLAVFMVLAVLRLMGFLGRTNNTNRSINIPAALTIGAVIGLLSGMIGIGGGIILSPVILILGWGNVKEAAATSALFILVNSIAGMLGLLSNNGTIPFEVIYLIPAGILGGYFGSLLGSKKLGTEQLRILLALVLSMAAIKLISL